jgi:hypothetical protein
VLGAGDRPIPTCGWRAIGRRRAHRPDRFR